MGRLYWGIHHTCGSISKDNYSHFQVIFTAKCQLYGDVETYHYPVNRKFKIYFENDDIQTAFYSLLEHRCTVCEDAKTFPQFRQFQDHMRKEHQLFACDLCLIHIKVIIH